MTEEVTLTAAEVAAAQEPEPVEEEVTANVGSTEPEDDDDVLDLTSLVPPRKLVRVPLEDNPKGEAFELRLLDDFGIADQQQLLRWSRKFEELWNKTEADLDESQKIELKFLLDAMFEKVLDAPEEVKVRIPDVIRSRVVTAFTLVPLLERQKREEEANKKEEAKKKTEGQSTTES